MKNSNLFNSEANVEVCFEDISKNIYFCRDMKFSEALELLNVSEEEAMWYSTDEDGEPWYTDFIEQETIEEILVRTQLSAECIINKYLEMT